MKAKIPELELDVDGYITLEQVGKLEIIKKHCELYRSSDVIPVTREIRIEQAIILARSQGYKIKSAF